MALVGEDDPAHAAVCCTEGILGMLDEKTKGNLTGDEERLLAQVLFDLRMRFVERSKGKQ